MVENYAQALHYRSYRLANRSPKYRETLSGYIGKFFKKPKLQMKANYLVRKEPIFIIGIQETFKLACDENRIHERATTKVLPYRAHEMVTNALNSRAFAEDETAPIVASVHNNYKRLHKILRYYAETIKYPLKIYATD